MRVLLVQSYLGGAEPLVYPIGLASIAACIKKHELKGIDLNLHKNPYDELRRVLSEFSPQAVLVSLRNIDSTNKRKVVFYYKFFKDALKAIRQASAGRIIVGGSGFSMYAREIMDDEETIDAGVFLEGENIIAGLLDNLDAPLRVKGVFYRQDGHVMFSGAPPQADLNRTTLPDRTIFPASAYKATPDAIGIETKRGCALKCIYCIYGFLNGRSYRLRSPRLIADEIEALSSHGIAEFTFVDSVFNIPMKHADEIMREILRRGLKVRWSAWFSEAGIRKDFIDLAIKAGCTKIILSPDGFGDKALKKLEKNITNSDIIRTFEVLNGIQGFELCYNFFKNPPGQTFKDFLAMLKFALKAKRKMKNRVHFEFNSMRIEPHTKLYDIALSEGFVKKGENLLFPRYYTSPRTRYIERFFNGMLALKGK
ncbi:MAG: radical SAM protein [Deltaproteobacteria bacterium]